MPPPPEDEEIDLGEDEEIDEDEDDGMDMFEALGSLLATEDGESLAEIVKRQADSTEKLALHLEMQNKILVKILSAITKMAPSSAVAPAEAA
jgi:chaperonin cofactor prefoldin